MTTKPNPNQGNEFHKFRTRSVNFIQEKYTDRGIEVKELLEAIKDHELYDAICDLLKINEVLDDFIPIPGAKRLVQDVMALERELVKFDIKSNLEKIDFSPNEHALKDFRFNSIEEESVLEITENDSVTAKPIRSASREFFSNLYNMEKYANSLMGEGLYHMIKENLSLLKQHDAGKLRKYRLIMDNEGAYFFRAIISEQYRNYDNRMAMVLGLFSIYNETIRSNTSFTLGGYEFNESMIRILVKQNEQRPIENLGKANYAFEISNNEIRQGALKFSGVLTIDYSKEEEEPESVYIKPQSDRYAFVTIPHSLSAKKAVQRLRDLEKYRENEALVFDDLMRISKIKDADQIRFELKRRIDNSTSEDIQRYKKDISGALANRIDSMYDFLKLLKKIDLIAEDIEAKEYLRYKAYDILMRKKV